MTETVSTNHQKKITLTLIGGKRWDIEFIGTITRRDIQKLKRVLFVEFAKVQRRRSTKKILAAEAARVAATKPKPVTIATPKTTPNPTIKRKELTDATQSS